MRQTSFADFHCSLARSLDVIGDWWTPLILRDLYLGLDKFEELAIDLGISRNLLTTRLEDLVDNGIVEREQYCERPPRDRYLLTDAGRELVPILAALTAWGDRWVTPPGGPPASFRHRTCGKQIVPTVSCPNCGDELTADEIEVRAGTGGRVAPGTMLLPELFANR